MGAIGRLSCRLRGRHKWEEHTDPVGTLTFCARCGALRHIPAADGAPKFQLHGACRRRLILKALAKDRSQHVRCLFTPWFGHRWMKTEKAGVQFLVCRRCGKESDVGKSDWMGHLGAGGV